MDFLLPEWLLALTLTLFVVDIFLATEVMSWCGILSLAIYFTWRIGPSWKWGILVFLLAFIGSGFLYYFVFRVFIGKPIRELIQRGAPDEVVERLKGATGTIHYVDGVPMFRWNGDELWPITPGFTANEGARVVVTSIKDGVVSVAAN